jgi:hypothetical protein
MNQGKIQEWSVDKDLTHSLASKNKRSSRKTMKI